MISTNRSMISRTSGRLKSVSVQGPNGEKRTTDFDHNALGQQTKAVDPEGRVSTSAYDELEIGRAHV